MSRPAIVVENLGKRYQIGRAADTPRFRLRVLLPFRRSPAAPPKNLDSFWALRDLSFTIEPGEVVGFIGRNGAGKSTLLKILSRVVTPTNGRVTMRGRVGSLLEVGTGFHPELTGRDNIYLNGAILGMPRAEIRRKFDEIVAFSEIARFLDTPVKRYSSGMYVRLAFAVAAHLEPDILLVDEVLAVGDAPFQKKCLGVMSDVATQGRTVLFVSHNMAAVQALCRRTLVLRDGTLLFDGPTAEALACYSGTFEDPTVPLSQRQDRQGHGRVRATAIRVLNRRGQPTISVGMGEPFTVEVHTHGHLPRAIVGILIGNMVRTQILRGYTWEQVPDEITLGPRNTITCSFSGVPLLHGTYGIHVWIGQRDVVADYVENAAPLTIEPRDVFGTGRMPDAGGGIAFCPAHWQIRRAQSDAPRSDLPLEAEACDACEPTPSSA